MMMVFYRSYRCEECPFLCQSSREYLYHLRDAHGNPGPIHECSKCDYSTRYQTKLTRHMSVHSRVDIGASSKPAVEKSAPKVSFKAILNEPLNINKKSIEEFKRRMKPIKLKIKKKFTVKSFKTEGKKLGGSMVSIILYCL